MVVTGYDINLLAAIDLFSSPDIGALKLPILPSSTFLQHFPPSSSKPKKLATTKGESKTYLCLYSQGLIP